ncbi:hypothetical protein [Streptomyces murinus]|uniref:hypothetical protein n=1 Tax=Streptomyces murinus TaxID=33900 RepID=UPI003F455D0C
MTTRELATLIWLLIGSLACLAVRDIRGSIVNVLKLMFQRKIFTALALYGALLFGLTWLVAQFGYWDSSLIGAVGFWFLFTGFKSFLQSADTGSKDGFFRERAVELVGLAAFFEFFLNIRTFSLPVEFFLQLVLAFLFLMRTVSKTKEELKSVSRLLGSLLALAILWLVVATIDNLVDHRSDIEVHDVIALYLVPIWLTVGSLPYIYLLSLYGGYESVMVRMRASEDPPVSWRAKLGVMVGLKGNLRQIHDFVGVWSRRAGVTGSFSGARRIVKEFKEARS